MSKLEAPQCSRNLRQLEANSPTTFDSPDHVCTGTAAKRTSGAWQKKGWTLRWASRVASLNNVQHHLCSHMVQPTAQAVVKQQYEDLMGVSLLGDPSKMASVFLLFPFVTQPNTGKSRTVFAVTFPPVPYSTRTLRFHCLQTTPPRTPATKSESTMKAWILQTACLWFALLKGASGYLVSG